jgi:hypothetical protein
MSPVFAAAFGELSIPQVAIDVHHALTPELRERIIDDIRTRIQEPSYRLLSPEQLRELARLDTGGPPFVSLYLQLTPERRIRPSRRLPTRSPMYWTRRSVLRSRPTSARSSAR